VHWGPVRAEDIPAYLFAGRKKSAAMRQVHFPLKARLEMTTVMVIFYAILFAIPLWVFWRAHFWLILGLMGVMSYFYGVLLPWLPGRDGLGKGAFIAALALVGFWGWALIQGDLSTGQVFNWSLGVGFLAFFIGGEFQGMSPLMRGEQANWTIEGLVGIGTLAAYGLGRLLLGG
jgi:hypothetical protein